MSAMPAGGVRQLPTDDCTKVQEPPPLAGRQALPCLRLLRLHPILVLLSCRGFTVRNFLPLAFLVALVFALAYPVPGRFLADITVLGDIRIVQVRTLALPDHPCMHWREG